MPRDWRRFEYPAYPSRLQPVFIQLITYVDGQVEPVLLKMSRILTNTHRSKYVYVSPAYNHPHHHRHLRRRERICNRHLTKQNLIPRQIGRGIILRS